MTTVNYIVDQSSALIEKLNSLTEFLGYDNYLINSDQNFNIVKIDSNVDPSQGFRVVTTNGVTSIIQYNQPDSNLSDLVDKLIQDDLGKARISKYRAIYGNFDGVIKAVNYLDRVDSPFYERFIEHLCVNNCQEGYSNLLNIIATKRNVGWIFDYMFMYSDNLAVFYQIFLRFRDQIIKDLKLNIDSFIKTIEYSETLDQISLKIEKK